jgi:hypothetical protein
VSAFAASCWLATLLTFNVLMFEVLFAKLGFWHSVLSNRSRLIVLLLLLISFFTGYFLYNSRYKRIAKKYSADSQSERRRGNLIAWLYLILTFGFFAAVVFYEPGYVAKM